MALPKFLLQIREGQTASVYRWTPALAARKDMRPITGQEAKKVLDTQKAERDARHKVATRDLFDDTEEDLTENELTASVAVAEIVKPAEHPSFKTQETMKADEIARIEGFKTKNDLEVYILEKYQLDMIPGDRKSMNEQATSLVAELARHDKLYVRLSE